VMMMMMMMVMVVAMTIFLRVMVVAMTIFLRFCFARLYRGLFFRPRCRDKGGSECRLRHNNRSTTSAGRRRQAIRCHAHLQDLSSSRILLHTQSPSPSTQSIHVSNKS
jgi:hypothetical protein